MYVSLMCVAFLVQGFETYALQFADIGNSDVWQASEFIYTCWYIMLCVYFVIEVTNLIVSVFLLLGSYFVC